jgi:hypothetical protein
VDASGDGWITAETVKWGASLGIPFRQEIRVVVFRYEDLASMNTECLHPTHPHYNEQACLDQLESISIPHTNFDPAPVSHGRRHPIFWQNDTLVAVAVTRPQGAQSGHCGVHVFDRVTKDRVYYYPGSFAPNVHQYPSEFTNYPDVNVYLIPNPMKLLEASNGDLLVFSHAGNIARLGTPSCTDVDRDGYAREGGECGDVDCDDNDPDVYPGAPEVCDNGIDDDCDGDGDSDDSECGGEYSSAANAEASLHGATSLKRSGAFNELALILIPMATILIIRVLRRRN